MGLTCYWQNLLDFVNVGNINEEQWVDGNNGQDQVWNEGNEFALGYADSEVTKNYLGQYDYETGKILSYNCGGGATSIFGYISQYISRQVVAKGMGVEELTRGKICRRGLDGP